MAIPHGDAFLQIAAILGLATLLGVAGQRLRQPLIIMFLVAGILTGPSCLGIIDVYDKIELLAHIGIALLLFIVGLKLDVHLIRTTGPVALATGLGQIVFTSAIGFLIALAFGIPTIGAIYVSVALTFSSTIIIVKLLSDKREIDALHGRIAIGFLIVQDIAAILALVALSTLGSRQPESGSAAAAFWIMGARGIGLLAAVALLMRSGLPWVVQRLASSQEMLTLFAVSWAVLLGAGSECLGFSKEVGAFLAGISLASTNYREAIGARLVGLRDFLLLFFFVDLGARLDGAAAGAHLSAALVFSAFVLIGNPLIVLMIMGAMGYRRRTGFLAGLTVAQISEFSLIVAAMGLQLGHITPDLMGFVTLVGVVTIFLSTYMILYSGQLYKWLSEPLKLFERRHPFRESSADSPKSGAPVEVILIGLGQYGSGLAECLLRRGKKLMGVDFDPQALERWRARGMSVCYGDVADPEILEQLPLTRAAWVVSTVRSRELNLTLAQMLRHRGYEGKMALAAASQGEAEVFRKAGAHVVLRPFQDAAEQAADALTHAMDLLSRDVDWPVALREVRLPSGSAFVGKRLQDIPVRSVTGASILAVSRAGIVHFDPGANFLLHPGDRIVILGLPEELVEAENFLKQIQPPSEDHGEGGLRMVEVRVAQESDLSGRTLAALGFRQRYGATVVGIRRGQEPIFAPRPDTKIQGGDDLIVVGSAKAVKALKGREPL